MAWVVCLVSFLQSSLVLFAPGLHLPAHSRATEDLLSILSKNVECNQICVCRYARLICSNMLDDAVASFSKPSSFDFYSIPYYEVD